MIGSGLDVGNVGNGLDLDNESKLRALSLLSLARKSIQMNKMATFVSNTDIKVDVFV